MANDFKRGLIFLKTLAHGQECYHLGLPHEIIRKWYDNNESTTPKISTSIGEG